MHFKRIYNNIKQHYRQAKEHRKDVLGKDNSQRKTGYQARFKS